MSTRHGFVLIVIDMLVDFFERAPALANQRQRLAAAINDLTTRFRRADQAVIWVRQEFKADLSDAFLDMRRDHLRLTIEGTEGSHVLPELERHPDDYEIVKKRYSAFFGTRLDALLSTLEAKTLVLAGINSHACVRMTAIDAFQRDHDIILATDCLGSYDQEHHDVSMKYLAARMSRVMSNERIGELLSGAPAG